MRGRPARREREHERVKTKQDGPDEDDHALLDTRQEQREGGEQSLEQRRRVERGKSTSTADVDDVRVGN